MKILAASLLMLALLAGCASPTPNLYTLETRSGAVRSSNARVIAIRAINLPRYLQRDEIVHASRPDRLIASDNDQWAEPLVDMIRRVLIADIAQRLPAPNVVSDNGTVAAQPDIIVNVDLERFEADEAGKVSLVGYFSIIEKNRPARVGRLGLTVSVSAGRTGDRVKAMSNALGQAADEVVHDLAE